LKISATVSKKKKKKHPYATLKTNRLMLFREVVAAYSEKQAEFTGYFRQQKLRF
jgi:hypothetical protein